jgi:hypothetical protein
MEPTVNQSTPWRQPHQGQAPAVSPPRSWCSPSVTSSARRHWPVATVTDAVSPDGQRALRDPERRERRSCSSARSTGGRLVAGERDPVAVVESRVDCVAGVGQRLEEQIDQSWTPGSKVTIGRPPAGSDAASSCSGGRRPG